ncbi:hypothetical protein EDC04DRAFT_538101 [Pisolithus marmoratus]|nr:hypothetical protein EDC04DRAFT_538101 [Pisolithus marmoratus]
MPMRPRHLRLSIAQRIRVQRSCCLYMRQSYRFVVVGGRPPFGRYDQRRTDQQCHPHTDCPFPTSENDRCGLLFEFERCEHQKTVEEANHRIEELEAQVVIRETELETRIHLPSRGTPEGDTGSRLPARPTKVRLCAKPLSEDCLRVLESHSARNRSMEMEIRDILVKLEEARLAAPSPSGPDCRPEALQHKTPSGNGSRSVRCTSLDTRTPCASTTLLSNRPPSLPSQNDEERQHHPFTIAPPDSPSAILAIFQLENHIREMSAQVEAAKTERQSLVVVAARQRRATSGMMKDNIEDILRIEGECVRLSARVYYLQQQMDKANTEVKSRESELLKEIEVLRSRVRRTSPPLVPVDASIAEESMELATPLQPTLLLSTRSDDTPSEPIDPSLIPLPFSPVRTSSPAFSAELGFSHSPTSLDIQRVQHALAMARDNLAQEANALSRLRTEVEDRRRQIPDPSPP